MPTVLIRTSGYERLLKEIRREIASGIREIELLAEKQKILTYWNIGRHIHEYLNQQDYERGAIGHFYRDVSKDLKLNERTLQHCEQFYRYFPKLKITPGLSWSHYRYLLKVDSPAGRDRWITKLRRHGWSSAELRLKLAHISQKPDAWIAASPSDIIRGRLYTYRLVKGNDIMKSTAPKWFVDCGFANRIETPPADSCLNNKWLYTSVKAKDGYSIKVTDALVEELYTFRARVIRVIDADTLLTLVDQGFGIRTEQRLRLRSIDAPELNTLAGKKAKHEVENILKNLSCIVVKTYKSDKYDRYLADVFYLPGEDDPHTIVAKGRLLNRDLVDRGLAVVWE